MTISTSQMAQYRAVINNGLSNLDEITDWETKFLRDFDTKLNTYGLQTFASAAQDETFDKIEEKLRKALGDSYSKT